MKMAKKISIVVMTYNREDMLRLCLESLFKQDYDPDCYEVIVVDDCSSDGTSLVVGGFKRKNLRYVRHDVNKGVAAARNTGIRNSKYGLIGFVADDYIIPRDYLSAADGFFRKHKDAMAVRFGMTPYDSGSFFMRLNHLYYMTSLKNITLRKDIDKVDCAKLYNVPFEGGCVIKKKLFGKYGNFNEELRSGEDAEMGSRQNSLIYFINNPKVMHIYPDKLFPLLLKRYKYGFNGFYFRDKEPFRFLHSLIFSQSELKIRLRHSKNVWEFMVYFPFLVLFIISKNLGLINAFVRYKIGNNVMKQMP